jgi:hypothetical protein
LQPNHRFGAIVPPIATEIVVLPKGFVAIGGKLVVKWPLSGLDRMAMKYEPSKNYLAKKILLKKIQPA